MTKTVGQSALSQAAEDAKEVDGVQRDSLSCDEAPLSGDTESKKAKPSGKCAGSKRKTNANSRKEDQAKDSKQRVKPISKESASKGSASSI